MKIRNSEISAKETLCHTILRDKYNVPLVTSRHSLVAKSAKCDDSSSFYIAITDHVPVVHGKNM